jgi:hypothetical protein
MSQPIIAPLPTRILKPARLRARWVSGLPGPLLRAASLVVLITAATALAACDRCGNFGPSSETQIGACHSDRPSQ